jgi:hypothetical protein
MQDTHRRSLRATRNSLLAVVLAATTAMGSDHHPPTPPAAGAAAHVLQPGAPAAARPNQTPSPGAARPSERLREGTRLVDERGIFQNLGDRIAFVPGGDKEPYRVLENLALERIGQKLDEGRGQQQWIVSGMITEFRGANYLLVTKAVIQLAEGDDGRP